MVTCSMKEPHSLLPCPTHRGWLCRMAHPLHDKEDFERLDTTLADLMAAAAAAAGAADGEGSGDALLRQGLADFSAAGARYEEGHEAVAVVLVELAAGQEGRPPNLEAVCVALQPMLQLGEVLRYGWAAISVCSTADMLVYGTQVVKAVAGAVVARHWWTTCEDVMLQAIAPYHRYSTPASC